MKFEQMYTLMDELSKLDFSDFNVYYTECHCKPILMAEKTSDGMLIEALIDPKRLMNNTDALRVIRGKDGVEILDYNISKADPKRYGRGYRILEYSAIADPTSEDKIHHGYIVYFQRNGKVKELWCSCRDYFYKLYAPYVKAGLATFNLDRKYQEYSPMTHNRQWTDKTNPEGDLYLCKHLYKVIDEVMNSETFVKKLMEPEDTEDEKIIRAINGDEFGKNVEKEKPKRTSIAKKKAPVIEPEEIEEPIEIEDELEELPPEEEIEEPIPSDEEEVQEPEEVIPSEVEEEEPEEETEFDKDLEDIVPAKNIKVNYPKEKKPAPPAKIGTGFTPKKSKDTV